MKTDRVRVRETQAKIIVSGDNVGIEITVPIATLFCALRIGRSFHTIVNNAAGQRGISRSVQTKMPGRSRAVINSAVRNVHRKAACCELSLCEALSTKPG